MNTDILKTINKIHITQMQREREREREREHISLGRVIWNLYRDDVSDVFLPCFVFQLVLVVFQGSYLM